MAYVGQTVLYGTQNGETVSEQAAMITHINEDGSLNLFVPVLGSIVTGVNNGTAAGEWTELVVPTTPTA